MEFLIYIAVFTAILAVSFVVMSKLKKNPGAATKEAGSAKSANGKANGKTEAGSAKTIDPVYGPIQIFFASQTGNAQNLAKILQQEAIQQGFVPEVIDLGSNPIEELKKSKLAVFTVSTYGEGEPPESCKPFDEWMIAAERAADEVSGLKFTVFALGNRQYQFFCEQGRKTDKHLERMGGQRIYRLGEGDDNESLEDDFNAWKEQIWEELKKYGSAAPESESGLKVKRQPSKAPEGLPFNLVYKQGEKEVDVVHYDNKDDGKNYNFQAKQYLASHSAKVTFSRELRQKTDDGSTLHVEIDISKNGISYMTAQNLALYPENTDDIVEKAARTFGVDLDAIFSLEEKENNGARVKFEHPFPTPISVKTYLSKFCDLQGPIKKKQLKELAQFCENPDHKKQLLLLASPEGKTEFDIQIHSRLKGLLDIIEDFNIKVPFENLVSIAAPIMPRHYTIASSNKKDPHSVHLCVSIYADRRPDAPIKYGLASAFLTGYHNILKQGNEVPDVKVSMINSTFVLPNDPGVPIIMVGPGAGIAPFRGFIEEKMHLVEKNLDNPYGEMTLFFGCRGSDWDYLYKEELIKLHDSKLLENYYVAFSRERDRKIYVQDLMEEEKKTITKILLEQNGTMYLCGSMAMGKAVIKRLAEIVSLHYNISLNEGEEKVIEMEKQKKINKELWG